ncbi:MAG: single-stranded DNA-binding protein [Flavobacteriales bacterium]|nr:single-stranded DNA-binding protein [Flavobacteriales bacterium]
MNNLRNRVLLIGNLGADPIIKSLGNNKMLAKLSLATSYSYKDSNGKKTTNTQWHNLIAWDHHARLIEQFVKKGNEIAIEGKLTHRKYEDKEGVSRVITEIVINELMMLGARKSE